MKHSSGNLESVLNGRDVRIKKAKIKDELFLEAEYTEELLGHGTNSTKLSCTVPVHDDLKQAFHKLHTHLAILCDEVDGDAVDIDLVSLSEFGVRSLTVGGSGESEGLVISGYKQGRYGIVNLNTPFVKYGDEDYPFISELCAAIEMCIFEVKQYLFEGKQAPEQQLELAFGRGDSDDPQQDIRDIQEAAMAGGEE